MEDLPYMQFYPADYLADCDVLSVGARGAWHTFLCKAWLARSASVSLKPAQWSRVFGATNVEQAERLIAEIEECEVGDVVREDSGRVTLVSRRIERDLKKMGATKKKKSEAARKAAKARWAKQKQSENDADAMPDVCATHASRNADAMPSDAIPEARSQKPEEESHSQRTSARGDLMPPTLAEVTKLAGSMPYALTDECAEAYWHDRESVGWMKKNQPITNWRADLSRFASHWNQNERSKPTNQKNRSGRTDSNSTGCSTNASEGIDVPVL